MVRQDPTARKRVSYTGRVGGGPQAEQKSTFLIAAQSATVDATRRQTFQSRNRSPSPKQRLCKHASKRRTYLRVAVCFCSQRRPRASITDAQIRLCLQAVATLSYPHPNCRARIARGSGVGHTLWSACAHTRTRPAPRALPSLARMSQAVRAHAPGTAVSRLAVRVLMFW